LIFINGCTISSIYYVSYDTTAMAAAWELTKGCVFYFEYIHVWAHAVA